jgi:hypothetical protein
MVAVIVCGAVTTMAIRYLAPLLAANENVRTPFVDVDSKYRRFARKTLCRSVFKEVASSEMSFVGNNFRWKKILDVLLLKGDRFVTRNGESENVKILTEKQCERDQAK